MTRGRGSPAATPLLLLAAMAAGERLVAAAPRALEVAGDGGSRCPTAEALAIALRPLLPATQISLGPSVGGAPQGGLVTGGAWARLAVGVGRLWCVLGVTAAAPLTESLGVGTATISRVPLDLGLRGALRRGRIEGDLDLGLSATVLSVAG